MVAEPQQKQRALKSLEVIDNKQVITIDKNNPQPTPPLVAIQDTAGPETSLENEVFRIDFSANQGTIKTLFSKPDNYASILDNFLNFSSTAKLESYRVDDKTFQFLYKDEGLEITKSLKVIDNNTLKGQVEYKNTSNLSNLKNVQFNLFSIDIHRIKDDKDKMHDNMLFEYSIFADNKIVRKSNAFKFSDKEQKTEQKTIEWAGWRDRYHFTVVKPEFKTVSYTIDPVDDYRLAIAVNAGEHKLDPGSTQRFDFTIYTGPQDLQLLKKLDGNVNKIMAFSGFALLDIIEKFIYNVLLFMNKFIPNWGVCIILISLLVYGATYPLTLKSMLSMRKMQELQPKMAELREKYKNNPQKLNTEVVQLYKIHNVNPLSGCLPMLLQMPVFISLYQVLWRTHNFQGAKFLWIKDLSEPDRLFVLSSSLPLIGNDLNILPLLMTVVMFFQQKLSSKNMVVTDEAQAMQQKMMLFVMPVFIGAIFYKFASGLTLYFTVFYLLSTLTQYKMSKLNKVQ